MSFKAVIFDLDGVIVSTDEYHFQGWKRLADEEGIYFDRAINERLRGVSRMESLNIVLEKSQKVYTEIEMQELATRKNEYYKKLLQKITNDDILPGVNIFLEELKEKGIKVAIASSSKNSPVILERIGLDSYFDATADGNDITRSKPDPEVFLLAAKKLQIEPQKCIGIEDAEAGVDSINAAGMFSVGIGFAANYAKAHYRINDLTELCISNLSGAYSLYQSGERL